VAAAKTMRRYSMVLIGRCNGLRLRLPLSQRGRAGAAHHRKATDNSGERRSADRAGQQPAPECSPRSSEHRIVSRTEEVAWASVRAGSVSQRSSTGMGGHQRSSTVQRNRRSRALRLKQLGERRREVQIVVPKVGVGVPSISALVSATHGPCFARSARRSRPVSSTRLGSHRYKVLGTGCAVSAEVAQYPTARCVLPKRARRLRRLGAWE
jgi:hypothetical protein